MNRVKCTLLLLASALLLLCSCSGWLAAGNEGVNHAPVITSTTAQPATITAEGSTTLTCAATDSDGDTLSFQWSGGGAFSTPTVASTDWTIETPGTFTLTCTVSDGRGQQATGTVDVTVVSAGNQAPIISDITADPTAVAPDADTTLTCTASDPDGEAMTFAWTGEGTFATPDAATTLWHHGVTGQFELTCTVTDTQGNFSTGTVFVSVTENPGENQAPLFGADGITKDVTAPVATQKVIFSVEVSDPDSDPLTITWDDGTGSGNFFDASYELNTAKVSWAAPAAGNFTITVIADDGRSAAHVINAATTSPALDVVVSALPTSFNWVGESTCAGCHPALATQWLTTPHSSALETHINPSPFGFRNEACYQCHAVGYPPIGTGGFIDQELTPQFANIQCEACHGGGNPPGAGLGHKPKPWDPAIGMMDDGAGNWVTDPSYDGSQGYGCGVCHQGERHGAFNEWIESRHATFPIFEDDGVTLQHNVSGAGCIKCHNGEYFVRIQIRGEAPPADDLTSVDAGKAHISCAVCHDNHNKQFEAQLRIDATAEVTIPFGESIDGTQVNAGLGNTCVMCHNGRRNIDDFNDQITNGSSHFGFHPNSQSTTLFGIGGAEFDGVTYTRTHPHQTMNPNTCVTCHMFRAGYDETNHTPALWGHDWTPRWEACATCHTQITDQATFDTFKSDFQAGVQDLLTQIEDLWPAAWKDTSTTPPTLRSVETAVGAGDGPPANDPAKGDLYRKVLWDYFYVAEDGSKGIHNPNYTVGLLESAVDELNTLNALP